MFCDEELNTFHGYSHRNEKEVRASQRCGCFYCFAFFSPEDIDQWWDENPDGLPLTATCPYCGIDSVLPESPDYVLDTAFIEAMGAFSFNGYARGNWLFRRSFSRRSLSILARDRHRLARYERRRNKTMNDKPERIIGLLDGWRLDDFGDLVAEIRDLEEGLAHPDQQSFYFNKAYDSKELHLSRLKERYEAIRQMINTSSLDDLRQRAETLETKWQEQKAVGRHSLNQAMGVGRLERLYQEAEALVEIKERLSQLKRIEDFDPDGEKQA